MADPNASPDPSSVSPSLDDPSTWTPQEPLALLFSEQANFAGISIGLIFYGITLVLFFQCIDGLLNSRSRTSTRVKWGLIGYVSVMFSLATLFTAFNTHLQQLSYVDNRNFPGIGDVVPPGPIGYTIFAYDTWRAVVANVSFTVSNWLADALLMYRCFILYNRQALVMVLPGLLFLGSLSMGIMTLYQTSQPNASLFTKVATNFGLPYFTIAISLNVILTLLMTSRIFLHTRRVKNALPSAASSLNSLYGRVITVLVESCALYSITSLLFIGPYAANNGASNIFLPILSQVQIIAPFLIILRVAKNESITQTSMSRTGGAGSGSSGGSTAFRSVAFRTPSNGTSTNQTLPPGVPLSPLYNGKFKVETPGNSEEDKDSSSIKMDLTQRYAV